MHLNCKILLKSSYSGFNKVVKTFVRILGSLFLSEIGPIFDMPKNNSCKCFMLVVKATGLQCILILSGASRIFYWRGKTGWGWGGAPENFSWTRLSTLAVNATNTHIMD